MTEDLNKLYEEEKARLEKEDAQLEAFVLCSSFEQAVKLLTEFDKLGKTWPGTSYTEETNYSGGYTLYSNRGVFAFSISSPVYAFDDIIFESDTINIRQLARSHGLSAGQIQVIAHDMDDELKAKVTDYVEDSDNALKRIDILADDLFEDFEHDTIIAEILDEIGDDICKLRQKLGELYREAVLYR